MSIGKTPQPLCDLQIRWMIRRDMPDVLEIERQAFETSWSEDDFLNCLRQRNCIGMVAEHHDQIVGYMIYELLKSQLHLLKFAVAGWARRQGVGTRMVEKLIAKLSQQRRHEITLEVRETNLEAQIFFRNRGLLATNVVRSHFEDTAEDAYVMRYCLTGTPLLSIHVPGAMPPGPHHQAKNRLSDYLDQDADDAEAA